MHRRDADHAPETGLESVDVVIGLLELLAAARAPRSMSDIARDLAVSKPRAHRHLRALMLAGYVLQDPDTGRYEISAKPLALAEAVRERFDVRSAAMPDMARLRDATGHTVTVSTLVEDAVVVLDLLPGRTLVEFGIRPGATLDAHASAHGLVALAFGPPRLHDSLRRAPLTAWTPATLTSVPDVMAATARVRRQGWATAPDQLLTGVNALAAPVFGGAGDWRGTIAIVGATQLIPADPPPALRAHVLDAAAAASRRLGWRGAA